MWRSLLRRRFFRERRLVLETLSFRGEDAFATTITHRAFAFRKAGAGAFFSSSTASSDQPLSDCNRIEREEEASHFDLDATRSTLTGETASTSTWDSSSRTSSFRNFLLCYPECVSVDENGSRIFISDSYHNRILITDIDGKILDCIGSSSPGFEDGEFEFAKLSCPAASYYFDTTDCLYFVDSENHALRRADLENRLVETVHPSYVKRSSGTWNWILGKLGFGKEVPLTTQELGSSAIKSPWHVIEIEDDNLLVMDRSFEIAWVIGANDGSIRESIRGSPSIINLCDNAIKERMYLLKDLHANLTIKRGKNALSLFSSIASVDKHAIFADTDSQRVMKYNLESKSMSCLRFSNFGLLGLPSWLICPLERVFTSGSIEKVREHVSDVKVLPGRCNLRVFVEVPGGTELVSPLDENSIWCQVRGSGSEISVLSQGQGQITNPEKVGVTQQWFDELDNLAFVEVEDDKTHNKREELISEIAIDKRKAQFDCAVQTSPGTCEVIVSAVLYLSIDNACENREEQKLIGSRLLLDMSSTSQPKVIDSFFENCEDLRDLIFVCPAHLRIKLECGDYPAANLNKGIVPTDSSININIVL
ncbi:NHL repeat-containing protein 2 [Carex littledalei]|uniref:NHL repeat-containing protein 2 n=1 Tax=Carex littledalei TaxID=544730 RepID=A0A833R498_9POAL|nr:NHL repeat-containing protein 2 [Carex littledalei]